MKTIYTLLIALCFGTPLLAQSYIAYANSNSELLDEGKNPIKLVEKGDAIYLVSDKPQNGYFNAVHIKTNKIGYIHAHHVKIHKEVSKEESGIFASTKNSDIKDPLIEMHNNSRDSMIVTLNKVEYAIAPHERKTIKVKKGRYYFRVSSRHLEPHYDYEKLEEFKKYEWEFYVEEEELHNPHHQRAQNN